MKNDQRILLTKRLLHEGLLRLMKNKPISGITVTELCRESGINRATFYKHYDSPIMLLNSVIESYVEGVRAAYYQNKEQSANYETALENALMYVYSQKEELRILLSENGENYLTSFLQKRIKNNLMEASVSMKEMRAVRISEFLQAVTISSGVISLISVWLIGNIEQTPKEIMQVLSHTFSVEVFSEKAW